MTEPCGVYIGRLIAHRGLDAAALAAVAGSGPGAVPGTAEPSLAVLGRLAPVLGLRVPDLCVMTEVPVPGELAPLDDRAEGWVDSLVYAACQLSPRSLGQLLATARALPQRDRTRSAPEPRPYEQYPPGFGGVLLRMLRNRNLGWTSSAKVIYLIGRSHYMSGSTVGMLGRGRKEMTPGLLADFAAILGIDAGDLAAMGGMEPPPHGLPAHPSARDMAELIWEARRLTREQVRQLTDQVKSMYTP